MRLLLFSAFFAFALSGLAWPSFGFDAQNTGLRVGTSVASQCLSVIKYGIDIDLVVDGTSVSVFSPKSSMLL